MNDHDAVLADRLNAESVIFRGCSSPELGVIVVMAAVFWLPNIVEVLSLAALSLWERAGERERTSATFVICGA